MDEAGNVRTSVAYGSLAFREQNEFLRRKLNLSTEGWTDVFGPEHDWAFVVAGANRDAIVSDFRQAVERAITQGGTIEDFRRDFDRIVATHGWDYRGSRAWRSRVIYETNLASSYAAGRYQQLQAAPFWQYVHSDAVEHPRPIHLEWDGLVLAREDTWWQTNYPPNGWGCRCQVRGLFTRDLERLGKRGPDQAPPLQMQTRVIGQRSELGPREVQVPRGVDPGFAHAPGRARLLSAIPPERPQPLIAGSAGSRGLPNRRPTDALPAARRFDAAQLLEDGLPQERYLADYLGRFGATPTQPAVFTDVVGERVVVGRELFVDVDGDLKVDKRGRGRLLPLLAQTLIEPDEIWVRLEWLAALGKAVVRRRYVARWEVQGLEQPALAVFELGADGWAGVTTFPGTTQGEDNWRVGLRLYRRTP